MSYKGMKICVVAITPSGHCREYREYMYSYWVLRMRRLDGNVHTK